MPDDAPTRQDIYDDGFNRGYDTASWVDLPEIGTKVKPFQVEAFVGTIENISDAEDVFVSIAHEAEGNSRQFSPFEFTAGELNELEQDESIDYDPWEAFDEGIHDGILENWTERSKDYYQEE